MAKSLPKSLETLNRAKKLIPGVSQLLSKRPDMFSYGVWPTYFSKASGSRVWDLDGNCYLDFSIGGIGANILGYADPDVDAAVGRAVQNGGSSSLNCVEDVDLAQKLVELHPWARMARFARTGGEAMAVAVRIARAATGRDKVAFCGYHGWHDWYLAGNLEGRDGLHLAGLSPVGVPRALAGTSLPFRFNRLDDLEEIVSQHGDQLAAIVTVPMRRMEPEPEFDQGLRRLADQTGAVLIMDEISAGFRLNTGGAHLIKFQTRPDLAVFSKALANGYPMAAIIGRAGIMSAAQETFISSTMWTERIGPTAALATIAKHERLEVGRMLDRVGRLVQQGWLASAKKYGLDMAVEGMPPMTHFTLAGKDWPKVKAYLIQLMLERGFLASNAFYAMHSHTEDQVESYLRAFDLSLAEVGRAVSQGDLDSKLKGRPSSAGFTRLD